MDKRANRAGLALLFVLLAACATIPSAPTPSGPAPTPSTPSVNSAAAAAATPTPASVLAPGALSNVPRNRTLVLAFPFGEPVGVTNPWNAQGYSHQDGNALLWEGLAYYAIFADKEIPWLAESMTYNNDFTQLTIKLNPQARWSDGQPVTAQDVVFTFDGIRSNDKLYYQLDFDEYVQSDRALDNQTVVVTFKKPAPRFKFEDLTLKFDSGVEIVPAHVLQPQANVSDFAGGLDIPHSGPYNLVAWDMNRKVFDLRSDWWAVKAGLIAQPAVQRVIVVNTGNASMDSVAQRIVKDEFDSTLDMRGNVIDNVMKQNPKITSYTGATPPYGYLDWWTNSLWVNTTLAPYSDVRVRRALSLAINRDQLNQFLYQGTPIATIYPFPLYPALQRFVDSPAVKALAAKYRPGKFDLAESARLMTDAGFSKNADGLWARDGQPLNATIDADPNIHADLAPVLVSMLQAAGFNAVVNFGPEAGNNMSDGKPGLYLFGHGASLVDPYATLELYHSRHSAPNGIPAQTYSFSRYDNPAYDSIIDAMAVLPADDPEFQALAAQAMEIYWRDVIDIPIVQWLHRIPYNTTYWTNWPTQANPVLGTTGAFWHQTSLLVITSLKPTQ